MRKASYILFIIYIPSVTFITTNAKLSADINSTEESDAMDTSLPATPEFATSPGRKCPKGSFFDYAGSCLLCEAGSYTSCDGLSSCIQCAPGKFSLEPAECDQESCFAEDNSTKIYRLYDRTVSWYDARRSCEDDGGQLVAVQSESANNFVTSSKRIVLFIS